jgi:hypothetical protein
MKKIVLIVGTIIVLMSCKNNNDTALNKLKSHIDSFASNKNTLETISLTSDTSYAHDRINKIIKSSEEFIKLNKEWMGEYEENIKSTEQQRDMYSGFLFSYSLHSSFNRLIAVHQKGLDDCIERDEEWNKKLKQEKIKFNRIKNGDEKDSIIINYTYQFKIKDINNKIIRDTAYLTYYQDKNIWEQVRWYNKK